MLQFVNAYHGKIAQVFDNPCGITFFYRPRTLSAWSIITLSVRGNYR